MSISSIHNQSLRNVANSFEEVEQQRQDSYSKKETAFEEISESKEMMEERIGRVKLQMVEMTMKQQELGEKMKNLEKDIEILQVKLEDTQG